VIDPVGQKRAAARGAPIAFECGHAAELFGWKKLEAGVAKIETAHDLARAGDARHERDRRFARGLYQLGCAARRKRVFRASFDRGVQIFFAEHSAGADDHLRRFVRDSAYRIERDWRAQCDFDRVDAAGEQHARQRHSVGGVIYGDDRDHRRKRKHGRGVLGFAHLSSVGLQGWAFQYVWRGYQRPQWR
jgi:hypothetical protein